MKTSDKTNSKFVFRKRFWVPIIVLLSLYLMVTTSWRKWNTIPVPHYIPQNSQWKLITKKSSRASWGLPSVYARFEVDQPQSIVAAQIKKIISELRKWESSSEQDSGPIYEKANGPLFEGLDKESKHKLMERDISSYIGLAGESMLNTESPFLLFSWFGHEEPATHHYITLRVIDSGDNKTIVELWDNRIYD